MRETYYGDYTYMRRVEENRITRLAYVQAKTRARKKRILLCTGIIITVLLCIIFSIRAFAYGVSDSNEAFGKKQYKSVVIFCGDTVESISREYYSMPYSSIDSLEDEIRKINNLSQDEILIPGNYLIVPYYNNIVITID